MILFLKVTLIFAGFLQSAQAQEVNQTLHLQSTVVSQQHGGFPAKYSGANSLSNGADEQTSLTLTAFIGRRVGRGGEFYIDPELSGGSGFNKTTGIAGFPNGEIYRVDDAGPHWNLARLYFKQVIGFGGPSEEVKDDKNQLGTSVAQRRLTAVVGRYALNDFYDNNSYSHDPRTQFLNWALMDYGAWDYAADTRGYSWGVLLEYNEPRWALRFASVMVPVRANQMELDSDFPNNRGDNLEYEYRFKNADRPGVLRLLVFENWANMGSYRDTVAKPAYGTDVTQTRGHRVKWGLGAGLEQSIADDIGAFGRLSWNDGHAETWAFTEIDQSASLGLSLTGHKWGRGGDSAGFALIVNDLSSDHKGYLARGGQGFVIGDGALNYASEEIAELYYLFQIQAGLSLTGDYQFVQNPAYNLDRGPVSIFAMRMHWEM